MKKTIKKIKIAYVAQENKIRVTVDNCQRCSFPLCICQKTANQLHKEGYF